ncbi:hypothetical protein, partial [Caballeronia sp. LZ024]|uniref:hypothetical protein n=1 Tax=Caballeronia sp. LZ024 TaxID=3038561 RepID=UPI0028663A5C
MTMIVTHASVTNVKPTSERLLVKACQRLQMAGKRARSPVMDVRVVSIRAVQIKSPEAKSKRP